MFAISQQDGSVPRNIKWLPLFDILSWTVPEYQHQDTLLPVTWEDLSFSTALRPEMGSRCGSFSLPVESGNLRKWM